VKWQLSRREENLDAGNRNATVQRLRVGARADGTHWHRKPLRRFDHFPKPHDSGLEPRDREVGHLDQLVRRLKDVEHGGQAKIEDAVENQDVYTHGAWQI